MKEWKYTFVRYDYFLDSMKKGASFDGEDAVCLLLLPYDYEMKLSDEVLNQSSCKGYRLKITNRGGVSISDWESKPLCEVSEGERTFSEFQIEKKGEILFVLFGHTETVDHYPNCDGEFDRYSTDWICDFKVAFDTKAEIIL